ncbi:MAG TPA: acyltransferase [Hellea balneolensis]|uniref:Acyltransferase n=1 Tax=Hellea balneolensis TaxID=287478 RepID=A0A7C3G9Y3_9PROT|nr:acyltransferase [Hellea balneolensis]
MINPKDHVPNLAPRLGNTVTRFIGRMIMGMMGYKIEGRYANEPKMILIAAPHTSNWDLLLAIGTMLSLGVRINFMMKKEGFVFPFKRLFIALGGVPLDRSSPKKAVKSTLNAFKEKEAFWLAILPEGTRKPVTMWKAGFIRIARQANVPIFMMGVDSRTKTLHLDKLIHPSNDAVKQAETLRLYAKEKYTGINPKND